MPSNGNMLSAGFSLSLVMARFLAFVGGVRGLKGQFPDQRHVSGLIDLQRVQWFPSQESFMRNFRPIT